MARRGGSIIAYIGIDVGTSGCKVAVVKKDGAITAVARRAYDMVQPAPGFAEVDLGIVWQSIKSAMKEIAPYSQDARGLAISSIGETMVFLDKNDKPLMNGILYLDSRCNDIAKKMDEDFGPGRLRSITGTPKNPMFSLFRYVWIRQNRPEVIENASKIFLLGDYFSYMFSGRRGIDYATASRTAFFDVHNLKWSEEIAKFFHIDIGLFSPVRRPGTLLGDIRQELAQELGLPPGINVFVGCHDQCGVTLGGGALAEGDVIGSEGSTEGFNLLMDQNLDLLVQKGIPFEPFVVPGQYFATVGHLAHGTSVRWFIEKVEYEMYSKCVASGQSAYDKAEELCARDSGNLLFLPYLSQVSFDGSAMDMLGGFIGMDTNTDTHKMYRAVLEGISFESRCAFSHYENLGIPLNTLKCTGGCTASKTLMQIKSDILGKDICVLKEIETGILGLGMICAVALGDYSGYPEVSRQFVKIAGTFKPQHDYTQKFDRYLRLKKHMKEFYREKP